MRMVGCFRSMMNQNILLSSINSPQLLLSHWELQEKLKFHMLDLEKKVWKQNNFVVQYYIFYRHGCCSSSGFQPNLRVSWRPGKQKYCLLCLFLALGKILIMIRCSAPTGSPPPLQWWPARSVFSCEDAAQQVLMSVCPCVCVTSSWN